MKHELTITIVVQAADVAPLSHVRSAVVNAIEQAFEYKTIGQFNPDIADDNKVHFVTAQ